VSQNVLDEPGTVKVGAHKSALLCVIDIAMTFDTASLASPDRSLPNKNSASAQEQGNPAGSLVHDPDI
jgi:hypothetical protein